MPVGQISDVCLADERQQMMLAQGIKVEVPAQDHLLVIFLGEERAIDSVLGVLTVAASQKLIGLGYPRRRALESFAFGVFAYVTQKLADRLFRPGAITIHGCCFSR